MALSGALTPAKKGSSALPMASEVLAWDLERAFLQSILRMTSSPSFDHKTLVAYSSRFLA
jgi:hypothetical protein